MDDIDPTLNNTVGEEANIEASSAEEPKATEEVETPTGEVEATVETEPEETKPETVETPKKGAQARIRELNSEKNKAVEKAKSLEQKLAELTGQVDQVPQTPYIPQIDAGGEVSPEQYRADVQKSAMSAAQLLIAQNNSINRINSEARDVLQKYPQLDPDSEHFDVELSESITEATEAYVKSNPYGASPKKFVDKLMKPYQRAVMKEVGQEKENLAKQVSQSATRPTSVTTKGGKSDTEKSIAELEAELGINQY